MRTFFLVSNFPWTFSPSVSLFIFFLFAHPLKTCNTSRQVLRLWTELELRYYSGMDVWFASGLTRCMTGGQARQLSCSSFCSTACSSVAPCLRLLCAWALLLHCVSTSLAVSDASGHVDLRRSRAMDVEQTMLLSRLLEVVLFASSEQHQQQQVSSFHAPLLSLGDPIGVQENNQIRQHFHFGFYVLSGWMHFR